MANNSTLSKRAALRQQQELEERQKRTKRILIAGGALLAITAVVIIAIVIFQALGGGSRRAAEQRTPPGTTERSGILLSAAPTADKPHLVIWQDFQCPACKSREETYGPAIEQLEQQGAITVEIRTAYFMDNQLLNDASQRAALAAAAAAEVGHYRQMHKTIFANQPAEGSGFTDQQLREDFPQQAGITGDNLKRYQELYDVTPFQEFVDKADERFQSDGIGSTPTYLVAGKPLQFANDNQVLVEPTAESMLEAVTKLWEENGKNNDF